MKIKILISVFLLLVLTACQKKDINALKGRVSDLENELASLKSMVTAANNDIKALQAIAAALQSKISVVLYAPTSEGYLLTMSDGSTIALKNGINGKDGADAPRIGVKQDTDGEYYWTLAGAFIVHNGNKMRVTGNDGANGQNGNDGADGITPQLKVDEAANEWLISYDNGITWNTVRDKNGSPVKATGPQGPQGQPGENGVANFTITDNGENIIITYQGNTYTLPKGNGSTNSNDYVMYLETTRERGQKIYIILNANLADKASVWVDLNNNQIKESNEGVPSFGDTISYTVNTSNIAIYGKVSYFSLVQTQVSELDVSRNNALLYLDCIFTGIKTLDLSKNTGLKTLWCIGNPISSLDLSKNKALEVLVYGGGSSGISSIDLSNNTALKELHINGDNQMASLNLLKNTALTNISISYMPNVASLDLSKNTALSSIRVSDMSNLISMDLSKNTALTNVYIQNIGKLTSLDLSKQTEIRKIFCCSNPQLETLMLPQTNTLTQLYCWLNKINSLNLSGNMGLKELYCSNNNISSMDLSKNTALTLLNIYSNKIKDANMEALINSLHASPTLKKATIVSTSSEEQNTIPVASALNTAKINQWQLFKINGGGESWVTDADGNIEVFVGGTLLNP